jgi:hypothetical protein
VLPHDQQLLTDQQLRDASPEQIDDLIQRIHLMLQMKGEPGLLRHPPEGHAGQPGPGESTHRPASD